MSTEGFLAKKGCSSVNYTPIVLHQTKNFGKLICSKQPQLRTLLAKKDQVFFGAPAASLLSGAEAGVVTGVAVAVSFDVA